MDTQATPSNGTNGTNTGAHNIPRPKNPKSPCWDLDRALALAVKVYKLNGAGREIPKTAIASTAGYTPTAGPFGRIIATLCMFGLLKRVRKDVYVFTELMTQYQRATVTNDAKAELECKREMFHKVPYWTAVAEKCGYPDEPFAPPIDTVAFYICDDHGFTPDRATKQAKRFLAAFTPLFVGGTGSGYAAKSDEVDDDGSDAETRLDDLEDELDTLAGERVYGTMDSTQKGKKISHPLPVSVEPAFLVVPSDLSLYEWKKLRRRVNALIDVEIEELEEAQAGS